MAAISNFLIDTSKKAYLLTDGSNLFGDALLKGDISIENLKSIGFTYKEEFDEGSNVLNGAFDKFGTQAKVLIDKILADSISGKITNSITQAENSDLKAKLTTLMTMVMQAQGASDDNVADMLDAFNLGLKYRIPYRKKIPAINATGSGFKIEFAYGKCNLFNAEEEVWKPMQTIKNHLFPTVTDVKEHPGLVQISGSKGVPYTQQSLMHVLRATKSASVKSIKMTVDNAEKEFKGMPEMLKAMTESAKSLINKSAEAEAIASADDYLTYLTEELDTGLSAEGGGKGDKQAFKEFQSLVKTINPNKKTLKEISKGQNSSWKVNEKNKELWDYVKEQWVSWKDTYSSKAKYTLKQLDEEGHQFQTLVTENAEVDEASLLLILKNIVNYQMYVEGEAAASVFNDLVDSQSLFYLYYGFAQNYYHTQTEVETFCKNASNAKIKIGPFVPDEVEILYDWKHLDDKGCPMAGSINFKSLFSLAPFGQGLSLGSANGLLGKVKPSTESTPDE